MLPETAWRGWTPQPPLDFCSHDARRHVTEAASSPSTAINTQPYRLRDPFPHPSDRKILRSSAVDLSKQRLAGAPLQDADLCEDPHWQDYHPRSRVLGYHRQRQGKDPGQGRHSTGPAAPHLCRQAARGWPHPGGLQHPEGVHPPPSASSPWWPVSSSAG